MKQVLLFVLIPFLCGCQMGSDNNSSTGPNHKPIVVRPNTGVIVTPSSTDKNIQGPIGQFNRSWHGNINTHTNELILYPVALEGGAFFSQCEEPGGCSFMYNKGESYRKYIGNNETLLEECTEIAGCSLHINQNDWYVEYCRNSGGCMLDGDKVTVPLHLFNKGEAFIEHNYVDNPDYNYYDHIVLGTEANKLPLRFAEFGYWAAVNTNNNQIGEIIVFAGGDNSKEINMAKLISEKDIKSTITYTGAAVAGISSGYDFVKAGERYLTDGHESGSGIIINGTAKLTLDSQSSVPNESLNMDFSKSGWYNVYMSGDGHNLQVSGLSTLGNPYKFSEVPNAPSDINIQYYGDNPSAVATEVVGTASINGATMTDGLKHDIQFSFGATKD